MRGRGREARPPHHLVERRDPAHPGSEQASGKRANTGFIQSAHNSSALIVSGISQGFNHTKCFDFSRMESRLLPNLANSYSTQFGSKYAFYFFQ